MQLWDYEKVDCWCGKGRRDYHSLRKKDWDTSSLKQVEAQLSFRKKIDFFYLPNEIGSFKIEKVSQPSHKHDIQFKPSSWRNDERLPRKRINETNFSSQQLREEKNGLIRMSW